MQSGRDRAYVPLIETDLDARDRSQVGMARASRRARTYVPAFDTDLDASDRSEWY